MGEQKTGQYVLLERVGMGGMAEVFRAASVGVEGFERTVAIKRILPNLTSDAEFVKMFVDEAKIAVQLQHPNIVAIFDLERDDEDLFIAMEYVHGKDLRAVLDRLQVVQGPQGVMPVGVAVHVTMKLCEALHHAHFAQGPAGQPLNIIHRDISPQNVLLSFDGEIKVTDFGLAKAAGRAVQTQAGVVKGKLAYMSPEQLRGLTLDHRSDVYGVGVLLWEMLTGVRLFLGRNEQETLRRVYEGKVPRPGALRADLHPELEAIVMRSLRASVDERFATAEEMLEELTAFAYGVGPAVNRHGVAQFMRELFPTEPSQVISSAPPAFAPTPTHVPPSRAGRPAPPPVFPADELTAMAKPPARPTQEAVRRPPARAAVVRGRIPPPLNLPGPPVPAAVPPRLGSTPFDEDEATVSGNLADLVPARPRVGQTEDSATQAQPRVFPKPAAVAPHVPRLAAEDPISEEAIEEIDFVDIPTDAGDVGDGVAWVDDTDTPGGRRSR